MSGSASEREQRRQHMLVRSLLSRDEAGSLHGWLKDGEARAVRGWQAYQANAGAVAECALAASFPTVQSLVGPESFAALARAFWQAQPPQRGDLAWFGQALPAFIEASEQLADVPYLADCARLDWCVAQAEQAADDVPDVGSLHLLGEGDPALLRLALMPGTALLSSPYPIVSAWHAHRPAPGAADPFAPVREALAEGRGEHALVWRQGWRIQVLALDAAAARWTQCLLQGATLDLALTQAGDGFAFEPWLVQALQRGWFARVRGTRTLASPSVISSATKEAS
ncbi:MAG TPA: DNA-binding domain-containing protein [Rhizobacter sp.]|nr:DNA-binding domain-containing protein [Rhizobacter sp.]